MIEKSKAKQKKQTNKQKQIHLGYKFELLRVF